MKKNFILRVALLVVLLASTGPFVFAQGSGTTLDSEEQNFLSLINQLRAQYGVAPVQVSPALENAAHWMSADMAAKNYYSSTDSLGRGSVTRLAAFGYVGNWNDQIGEGYPAAVSIFFPWMSYCVPGTNCVHSYSDMMRSTAYQVVGIGRAYNANSQYGWYWNVVFGSAPTAPSAPTLMSVVPKGANEVDLVWNAAPGTVSIGGYQIIRNGSVLTSISGATAYSYADTTVSPNTSYTYNVKVYDLVGNYSNASNSVQVTTPPGSVVSLPTVSSLTVSPTVIAAGQSATLSWATSGATSLTIDNGIGSVSGLTSKSVSPVGTTTYTLTASNAAGTASARVTVTVTPGPTVPTLLSAVARSSTAVQITWSAASGNVAGYQITRSGSAPVTVPATATYYTDLVASPNTTYFYSIRAYDSTANYSAPSNSLQVTTPSLASPPTCPPPATGAFTGCYYNNITLAGSPVLTRSDSQVNFNWGSGSPDPSVQAGNFSVRWEGTFSFLQGTYTFTALTSDGIRVYLDGILVLDKWHDQTSSTYNFAQTVSQGSHLVAVEYYEHTNVGTTGLSWVKN